ncbi:MAG: DUF58 domain-containing protein [Thermosphaera sp.]
MSSSVYATRRILGVLLLSAVSISMGAFLDFKLTLIGLSLLFGTLAFKGYVLIAGLAASRLEVEWVYKGNIEGEELEVVAVLKNKTIVPIGFLEVSLKYSPNLRLIEGARGGVLAIPPRSIVQFRAIFKARVGCHKIGPFTVVVRDVLGLFRTDEFEIGGNICVKIKPRVSELVVKKLFAYSRTVGLTRSGRPGHGVEFYDVREYRTGDELRRLEWKRLASRNLLAVKEMEQEAFQNVIFIVDATSFTMRGPYGNTPYEHVARIVSSTARALSARGDALGLVLYSDRKVLSTGGLTRGKRAFYEIVNLLSTLEYDPAPVADEEARLRSISNALKETLRIMPRERNAVFWFTTTGGEAYAEKLAGIVERLAGMGNNVYVIIPVITAYELLDLDKTAKMIYRVKTAQQTRKDIGFAKYLRKRGVKAVAIGPEHIPQLVIDIVETLSTR